MLTPKDPKERSALLLAIQKRLKELEEAKAAERTVTEPTVKGLTEKDAAIAYARAWNRLEPTGFLEMLAPDAHYASQWVLDELESKDAITNYLIGKMRTVKSHSLNDQTTKVFAELGMTTRGSLGRDCVVLAQGHKEKIAAVVLFDVTAVNIKRFDLCIPQLLGAVRTGVVPI